MTGHDVPRPCPIGELGIIPVLEDSALRITVLRIFVFRDGLVHQSPVSVILNDVRVVAHSWNLASETVNILHNVHRSKDAY